MLDPIYKITDQGSVSYDMMIKNPNEGSNSYEGSNQNEVSNPNEGLNPNDGSSEEGVQRICVDCGTSKTPLWRGGPAGPKSLCNACGIRSRKKRRAILGITKAGVNGGVGGGGVGIGGGAAVDNNVQKTIQKGKRSNNHKQLGDGLKKRLMALGREVLMQRSTVERQRKKLGEEEQAAVLLMALSYGSVSA